MTLEIQIGDAFAFRHEKFVIQELLDGCDYAVRLVAVEPPGPTPETATSTINGGLPIEHQAVVASRRSPDGLWHWMQLAPQSKEAVGKALADGPLRDAALQGWLGMVLEPLDGAA